MSMNPIYILIVIAIFLLGFIEVLISYEKNQMKKQFLSELDKIDKNEEEKRAESSQG